VITRDVEADALAVTRPETLTKQGWATTFRAIMKARKAAK
jgi:bifunctional UDP-N-acetylglucosamine pyrophosphorylase/glucosamine-1-phosphate N-acetyltransferase